MMLTGRLRVLSLVDKDGTTRLDGNCTSTGKQWSLKLSGKVDVHVDDLVDFSAEVLPFLKGDKSMYLKADQFTLKRVGERVAVKE